MADFSARNNLQKQMVNAELARIYNAQSSQLYSNLLASSMMNGGKNGLGGRNNSGFVNPQPMVASGAGLYANAGWDEFLRQQRAWHSRNTATQNFGMTSYERELAMLQLQVNGAGASNGSSASGSAISNSGATAKWSPGLAAAAADSPSLSTSVAAPSLSNSIWSTKSLLGASVDVGGDSDMKDVAVLERDTNANVVSRTPTERLGELRNNEGLRRIWESGDEPDKSSMSKLGEGFSGFKSPAFGSGGSVAEALTAFAEKEKEGSPVASGVSGSDSDEEFAIKSKHFRRHRKASLMSNGESEDGEDQFGLRSLLKKMKEYPNGNDVKEEREFVEKIFNTQTGPVHTYIRSPWSNNVVTPLCDYPDSPQEYSSITTLLAKHLKGPHSFANWPTDLLLFFFYTAVGDVLQLIAANLLHGRGWRYSKSRSAWIARKKDTQPEFKSSTYESGYYQYFNPTKWSREYAYFTLHYSDLADNIPFDEARVLADAQVSRINPFMRPDLAKGLPDSAFKGNK